MTDREALEYAIKQVLLSPFSSGRADKLMALRGAISELPCEYENGAYYRVKWNRGGPYHIVKFGHTQFFEIGTEHKYDASDFHKIGDKVDMGGGDDD